MAYFKTALQSCSKVAIVLGLVVLSPCLAEEGEIPRSAWELTDSIGMNASMPRPYYHDGAAFKKTLGLLQELGIRHVRYDLPQNPQSPVTGQIQDFAKAGIKSLLVSRLKVDGQGAYHCDDPVKCTSLPADVVTLIHAIGAQALDGIEGPNEYADGSHNNDPQAYTKLYHFMVQLNQAMRADPMAKQVAIVGPTLDPSPYLINAATHKPWDLWDISPIPNFNDWVAWANVHIYDLPWDESSLGKKDRNWFASRLFKHNIDAYRGIPLQKFYMTETGFTTSANVLKYSRAVTAETQARLVPLQILRYLEQGFKRVYLYQLMDRGIDSNDSEQNFGIVKLDWSPKPAFVALKRMMALLQDESSPFALKPLDFKLVSENKNIRHILIQKRNGDYFLAVFVTAPEADWAHSKIHLQLNKAQKSIRVFSPVVADAPIQTSSSAQDLDIDLSSQPVLIQLSNQ